MYIFPAVCKRSRNKALTVTEVILVLIIIGMAATIGTVSWRRHIELERETNAKTVLRVIWQAEESYFSWKNNYTNDWSMLALQDPHITDKFFTYSIDDASARTVSISATRNGAGTGFRIDQNGTITKF